jgi:hypothetical protein
VVRAAPFFSFTTDLLTVTAEESQRYRELVVIRDNEIQQVKEQNTMNAVDLRRLEEEQESFMQQIRNLEEELALAQKTQAALDEQKQENMALKEVIDRMRFEMDEMRVAAASGLGSSGGASAKNTISKSLGAEMMKMLEKEEESAKVVEQEEEEEDEDTEGEDVIQTIITRTKRVGVFSVVFEIPTDLLL